MATIKIRSAVALAALLAACADDPPASTVVPTSGGGFGDYLDNEYVPGYGDYHDIDDPMPTDWNDMSSIYD